MEDAQIQAETTEEWVYTFHGRVLTIQLEDAENGDRWSADFTAQYIEELTLKAGNYKKFGVFTTMLMSAFSKNSESVYVDLLTHSDIVVLKAKKSGIDTSQVTQNDAIRRSSQHKRYLVLTYTGEFDRVHFPLPLSFEETPNAIALQKSIRRLRAKLKEKRETDLEPSSEREKELRQIVAQLRQDNTELRHRLRHAGKAVAAVGAGAASVSELSLLMSPGTQTLLHADLQAAGGAHSNAELARDNMKLRKQNEEFKKQMKENTVYIEKLKAEHAREITRWKSRLGGVSLVDAVSDRDRERRRAEEQVIAELKRRIMGLERELKTERLSRGRPSSTTSNRLVASRSASPAASITAARIRHNSGSPANAISRHGTNGTSTRTPHSSGPHISSHYSNQTQRTSSSNHRYQSPQSATSVSGQGKLVNNSFNNEMSPSSSLGGRFDPTAYHRYTQQQQKPDHLKKTKKRKSTPTSYRYEDNGYSSAGSRESINSRSQRSVRSVNSQASQPSRQSNSPYSDNDRRKVRSDPKPSKGTSSTKDATRTAASVNSSRSRNGKRQVKHQSPSSVSGSDSELENRSEERHRKAADSHSSTRRKAANNFKRIDSFDDSNEIPVNYDNQVGSTPNRKVVKNYTDDGLTRLNNSKGKTYKDNNTDELDEMHFKATENSIHRHIQHHQPEEPQSHAHNKSGDVGSARENAMRVSRSQEYYTSGNVAHSHNHEPNIEIAHKIQQMKKIAGEGTDSRLSSSGGALRRSREGSQGASAEPTVASSSTTTGSELSDIDKRIQALHSFLEAARVNVGKSGAT